MCNWLHARSNKLEWLLTNLISIFRVEVQESVSTGNALLPRVTRSTEYSSYSPSIDLLSSKGIMSKEEEGMIFIEELIMIANEDRNNQSSRQAQPLLYLMESCNRKTLRKYYTQTCQNFRIEV